MLYTGDSRASLDIGANAMRPCILSTVGLAAMKTWGYCESQFRVSRHKVEVDRVSSCP